MSVSTISPSAVQTPHAHHAHHAGGHRGQPPASATSPSTGTTAAGATSDAAETLQQRARQGDPTAIAELRADRQGHAPTATAGTAGPSTTQPSGGASEPGKGEQVDAYA